MSKTLGILFLVLGLWATGEIYNKGTANAFGGILVDLGMVEATEHEPVAERAGAAVADAHSEADTRRNHLLAD